MRFSIRRKNKIAVMLLGVLLGVLPVAAQAPDVNPEENKAPETVREYFPRLNVPALDMLKVSTRLDMLDYWDADSVYKARNAMDGLSWIEELTPDYMRVRLTPVSLLELKLLPMKKEKVLMEIYTVGDDSQAQDSEVSFVNDRFQPLSRKSMIKVPELKDFFDIPKGSATTMKEIREMIPFPTMAYSASADSDNVTVRLTVEKFMDVDDYNIVKLFLKPEITLFWNGVRLQYKK